ncbi:Hypothetical protein D9617_2g053480 [Elsinoe fawcettii]|nr:Hypothetical protein D9617_2g053480 [Elsinoe fawcettii]
MNTPSISISWFIGPPKLSRVLGENHAWATASPRFLGEVIQVDGLDIDSIGVPPLKVQVNREVISYEEVEVTVKNVARQQKWKPGLDWYRHVFGVRDFVKMQDEFRKELSNEIKGSIERRGGSGISLKEVELIMSSIYSFVHDMDDLAHQDRQDAKSQWDTENAPIHQQKPKRFELPVGESFDITTKESDNTAANEVADVLDDLAMDEHDSKVYRDEDNKKLRQKLWEECEEKYKTLEFTSVETKHGKVDEVNLIDFF